MDPAAPNPRSRRPGTLGDLLSHFLTRVPTNPIERSQVTRIVTVLAQRLGNPADPFAVPLCPAAVLECAFAEYLQEQLAAQQLAKSTADALRSHFRHLLENAWQVVDEQGGQELTDLPSLPLPAQPAEKYRAETLGQLRDLYLKSGDCPPSVQPNIPGVFRRCAELVGDTSDPYAVSLWHCNGLLNLYEQDLWARQARDDLRAESVPRYLSWLRQALLWACGHLLQRDVNTPLELLLELDPRQHRLLDWLKEQGAKVERQRVRQFFLWLEEQQLPLEALATADEALTRRFAHDHLRKQGLLHWRKHYSDTRRGLRKLQVAQLLPDFPLYQLARSLPSYGLPWQDIPHEELRRRAETYARVADDEEAIDERTGRVVRPQTRDGRLRILGQYIGFLVQIQRLDLAMMTVDEIFSRANLQAFLAFLKERQDDRLTGGTEGTLHQLRHLICGFFQIPEDRFDKLIDPNKVEHAPRAGRIPTLDDFHQLVDALQQAASQPENRRTPQQAGATARLHAMLVLLNDFPMPSYALCRLKLKDQLYQAPRTERWTLKFAANELNANHPFDYPLSDYAQAVLEGYLKPGRLQILQERKSDYVFPTTTGQPILPAAFEQHLVAWDCRLRGVEPAQALTPNLIRDLVEHTCLLFLPDSGPLIASTLLQNSRIKTREDHLLDEVGRSAIQRDDRMARWVGKDDIGPEDVRKIMAELKTNPHDWRRFQKAVLALKAAQPPRS